MVYVIKKTRHSNGFVEERNMAFTEAFWEKIVSGNAKENNVSWELRKAKPIDMTETVILAPNPVNPTSETILITNKQTNDQSNTDQQRRKPGRAGKIIS